MSFCRWVSSKAARSGEKLVPSVSAGSRVLDYSQAYPTLLLKRLPGRDRVHVSVCTVSCFFSIVNSKGLSVFLKVAGPPRGEVLPGEKNSAKSNDEYPGLRQIQLLLAELFMFDQADLDFGIYRIMNAKRDEIIRFLDNDLLPQVKKALSTFDVSNRAEVEADLEKATKAATQLGISPGRKPKSPGTSPATRRNNERSRG